MDAEQFVDIVKIIVRDASVTGTIENLTKPVGRKPPQELLTASQWYNNLDDEGIHALHYIMKRVADRSLFGLFCVLDGVRVVESTPDKGEFEVYFVKNGERVLLNKPDGPMLHELYNAV